MEVKMKKMVYFLLYFLLLLIISCSRNNSNPISPSITPIYELDYKIIFTSDRDSDGLINIELGTKCEIYSLSNNSSNQMRITNNDKYDFSPRYSKDGSKIVYTSAEDWLMSDIVCMNEDGTNVINLGHGEHPKFSNDNSKILYKTGGLIGIINTDGSNKVVLTTWADSIYSTLGQDYPVQFSSDDSRILFLSRKNNNSDIYTMSTDGTDVERLTFDSSYDGNCSFSIDDTKVLFDSYRTGVSQIYIMDSDGNNKEQLTTTVAYNNKAKFSPNGFEIAFTSYRDGKTEIYIMGIDGSNQRRLSNANTQKYNLSFSPDGKFLIYHEREIENMNEKKWDICLMNIESGEIFNLTNGEGNNFNPSFYPIE
jgi:Tol biopolymer transport system component